MCSTLEWYWCAFRQPCQHLVSWVESRPACIKPKRLDLDCRACAAKRLDGTSLWRNRIRIGVWDRGSIQTLWTRYWRRPTDTRSECNRYCWCVRRHCIEILLCAVPRLTDNGCVDHGHCGGVSNPECDICYERNCCGHSAWRWDRREIWPTKNNLAARLWWSIAWGLRAFWSRFAHPWRSYHRVTVRFRQGNKISHGLLVGESIST